MPNVKANGIQIEYDTFGNSSSPSTIAALSFGSQVTPLYNTNKRSNTNDNT